MERVTIAHAKDLFGANFIGLEELQFLFERMGLSSCSFQVPDIHYSVGDLK